MRLPIDIGGFDRGSVKPASLTDENSEGKNPLGNSLPTKPRSLDPWDVLKNDIDQHPNDLSLWDRLFQLLEQEFAARYDPLGDAIGPSFKKFSYQAYSDLLARFPYLTKYWKQFLIFEYKLNGIKASVDVLSKSVNQFPYSVSLWVDYLSALITKGEDADFIRSQFQLALKHNAYHFLSHPIWDKLFEFEQNIGGEESTFWLYLKVIKLPLYQYAQYYQKFTEVNKKHSLQDLFSDENDPNSVLQTYLSTYNKLVANELTKAERFQIVDDFSYKIFVKTQAKVNDKWEYESLIAHPEFGLEPISDEDVIQWIKYLDYEIACFKDERNPQQFKLVVNLFERALIPNCLDPKFWLKYIAFLNDYDDEGPEAKFERLDNVYRRAVDKFVPLDRNGIRFSYFYFLMHFNKSDDANHYLRNLISWLQRENNTDDYIKGIELLLDLEGEQLIQTLISQFFEPSSTPKSLVDHTTINLFNDNSVESVMSKYLSRLLLHINEDSVLKLRSFFNSHHQDTRLQASPKFWAFYVHFEGVLCHNTENLKRLMHWVKTKSRLPKLVVDALVELEYDILSADLYRVLSDAALRGHPNDVFIKRDIETSESLAHNGSWRARLAGMNYQLQDGEHGGKNTKTFDNYTRYLQKRIGQAGAVLKNAPEILNGLAHVSLTAKVNIPDFPQCKNTEKGT